MRLLLEAAPGGGVGVRRDRHAGLAVRLRDGPQHPLDAGRDTGFVGGALEDCRLDTRARDAVGDVADEHVGHDLRAVEQGARPAEVEVHRHVVVGVDAGGDDDVDVGGRRDARDAGDVAAEPDHRQVDDAVDAAGLELVQALDRVGLTFGLVAPHLGMVGIDLGGQHEDVFVHQRHAEVGGVDGSSSGIQLRHSADATDAASAPTEIRASSWTPAECPA